MCKRFLVYTDFDDNVQKNKKHHVDCTSYSKMTTVLFKRPLPGPVGKLAAVLTWVIPVLHKDIKRGPEMVWYEI